MKLWPLLGSLILILATPPAYAADEPPAGAGDRPPPFSLEPATDDPPETLRFKAALRLLKSAQATTLALKGCGAGEAEKALKNYTAKNGNTLSQAMGVIRAAGGFGQDIKEVVEREALRESAELSRDAACDALAARILDGERDLYKAPQLAEDYRLMRGGR